MPFSVCLGGISDARNRSSSAVAASKSELSPSFLSLPSATDPQSVNVVATKEDCGSAPTRCRTTRRFRLSREDPDRFQPAAAGARACSWPYGPCECKLHSIWLSLEATVTCRPLLAVNVGSSISRFTVADALRPLNHDVCPHIKLNDPVVLKHFPEDYQLSQAICNCKGCRSPIQASECVVCKARFRYELAQPLNEWKESSQSSSPAIFGRFPGHQRPQLALSVIITMRVCGPGTCAGHLSYGSFDPRDTVQCPIETMEDS